MLTTASVRFALKQNDLELGASGRSLARLVWLANRELRELGHSGHQVSVERITPYFGDSEVLRCSLWCETCHVSHHALLDTPFSRTDSIDPNASDSGEADSRSRRRWMLWLPNWGLMQRILR